MRPLGLVELQRAGERLENALRDAACVAALEAGVVVDADPGEERDLLAAQAGNAPVATVRAQARLLRCDLRPPRGQELADLVPRVHEPRVTPRRATLRGSAGTWINRVGQARDHHASVVTANRDTDQGDAMQKRTLGTAAGGLGDRARLHGDEPRATARPPTGRR